MEADGSEPVNTKLDSSIASCYVICERMTHCVTKSCYLEARNVVEGGIFCECSYNSVCNFGAK